MAIFAIENYGLVLDTAKPLKTLRKELMAAAAAAEKQTEAAGADLA